MTRRTLALVESPTQLLNVVEWCDAARAASDTRVVVLAPRDATGRRQLLSVAEAAAEAALPVRFCDLRDGAGAVARGLGGLWREVAAADRLVVGDPFSGLIQAVLPAAGAAEVVVLDDGTATLEFAEALAAGAGLSRWDRDDAGWRGRLRAPLGRLARRLLSPAADRSLTLFTAMPVRRVPQVAVHANRYHWTRRQGIGSPVVPGTDVVGSSLVESGLVRPQAYLDAVARLATGPRPAGRYFAHRRESEAKLAELATRTGLRVVRPDLPLEIVVSRTAVAERLVCFPSSVAFTLPAVLASVPTRIELVPVGPDWWQPGVSERARGFLARLAGYLPGESVEPVSPGGRAPAASPGS